MFRLELFCLLISVYLTLCNAANSTSNVQLIGNPVEPNNFIPSLRGVYSILVRNFVFSEGSILIAFSVYFQQNPNKVPIVFQIWRPNEDNSNYTLIFHMQHTQVVTSGREDVYIASQIGLGIKCVKLQSTDILGLAFYTTPPVVAAVYDTSNVNTFFYGSDTTQITVGQQFIFSSSAPYAARMSIAGWLETNPDTVNRYEPDANGNVQCPLSVIPEYNARSTMQPFTEFVTQPPRGPATGERGSDGDMGTIGPIGPTGAPGVIGVAPTGYEGEIGVTGVDGLIGAQVNGSIGAVGPQGNVTGPTGPQGYQGPIGLRGPPGPRGPAYNSSLDPQASTNEQGNKNTLVMGIIIWAAVLSFVTIIVFIILIVYCCRVMAEGKRNEDDGLEGDPINAKTYSSIENKTYGAPDTPGELRHRPQAKEKAKEKEKAKDKVKPKKKKVPTATLR